MPFLPDTNASLPFDDLAARHCSEIRHQLEAHGNAIGPYDLMIAAIARGSWIDAGQLGPEFWPRAGTDARGLGSSLSSDPEQRAVPDLRRATACLGEGREVASVGLGTAVARCRHAGNREPRETRELL